MRTYLIGFIFLFVFSPRINAQDLSTILADAFKSDPTYQSAEANFNALKETYPQALSNLLPNLSVSANASASTLLVRGSSVSILPVGYQSFGVNGYAVTLTQPLFDFARFMKLKQADAQVKQAYANYLAAGQDLIVRTTKAYFAVLLAQDTLLFSTKNREALQAQYVETKARYKTGVETKTAVDEAQAALDGSLAQEIAAKNDVENSKEALRGLTGYVVDRVSPLGKKKFKLVKPYPLNVETWITKANQQNLTLQSARFAMIAAQKQIKMNAAGHMPTLNMVTNYSQQNGDFFGLVNDNQSNVGIQLALPIYEGGQVNSDVRQAKYQYIQAGDQVEKAYRDTLIVTRQMFNSVMTDVAKVKADQQSLISMQSALESTKAAYHAGTRTVVDVIAAIKNFHQAKQILMQDSYLYITDTILLKQEVGELSNKDIDALNHWLDTSIKSNH